mmetsp:Transcript_19482/g.57946  ORF Transcript_19482/g.57946 Transcript_19482/m.57946 type:complete len:257 (+) Transcript_19482:79-849(+)
MTTTTTSSTPRGAASCRKSFSAVACDLSTTRSAVGSAATCTQNEPAPRRATNFCASQAQTFTMFAGATTSTRRAPPATSEAMTARAWTVLPRPGSSASTQPPAPRSRASIQATPDRWYSASLAVKASGVSPASGACPSSPASRGSKLKLRENPARRSLRPPRQPPRLLCHVRTSSALASQQLASGPAASELISSRQRLTAPSPIAMRRPRARRDNRVKTGLGTQLVACPAGVLQACLERARRGRGLNMPAPRRPSS